MEIRATRAARPRPGRPRFSVDERHSVVFNWLDVYWNEYIERHIAEHGLGLPDVRNAVWYPESEDTSDSSGRPLRYGFAIDGRLIAVVFEMLDEITVLPITAYEVKL